MQLGAMSSFIRWIRGRSNAHLVAGKQPPRSDRLRWQRQSEKHILILLFAGIRGAQSVNWGERRVEAYHVWREAGTLICVNNTAVRAAQTAGGCGLPTYYEWHHRSGCTLPPFGPALIRTDILQETLLVLHSMPFMVKEHVQEPHKLFIVLINPEPKGRRTCWD